MTQSPKKRVRNVPGWPYSVSEIGDVFNSKNRKMTPSKDKTGYLRVSLSGSGKHKSFGVHRLVMMAFNPDGEKREVNHINGVKDDNRVENLEWCSSSENKIHAHKMGLMCIKGDKHPRARLSDSDILEIRFLYDTRMPTREIATKFNIHISYVRLIGKRKYRAQYLEHKGE